MVEKKQMEESLSDKKDELASIDNQLEQAVSIDIFNKADWYNPISIYQEKKAKDKQIADIKEKKEQLSKEVSEIEAELTAKSEKCQSLQDDMEQLRQEISIAAPDTDINEILSGQDAEDINRIKSDKIDLFISENKGGAEDSSQLQLAGLPPFIIPVSDYVVTSDFGYRVHPIYGTEKFHSGTDLGVDYGTPVRASNYGKVVYAGWYSGFGNTVVLSHAEGVYTLYGHNEKVLVSTGDIVQQGQQIALAGSTGNSTGPHCHFSMWVNNQLVNPMDYVSK